ncbi:hypothetical protein MMC32_006732 [Xylographa parallela]|nr:hypothetical protein [Xylographa parallela]
MLDRLKELVFCLDTLDQKNIKCPKLIGIAAEDSKLRVSKIKDHLSRYTSLRGPSAGIVGAKERIKWACGSGHAELLELLRKQNDDLCVVYSCFTSRLMLDVHEKISNLRQSEPSFISTTQPSETVSEDRGNTWKQGLNGLEEIIMTEDTFHTSGEYLVAYIDALKMQGVDRHLSSPQLELVSPTGTEALSALGATSSAQISLESDADVSLHQSQETDLNVLSTRTFSPTGILRNLGSSGLTLDMGYSRSSTPYLPKAVPISRNMSIATQDSTRDGSILPRQPKKRRVSGISIPDIINKLGSSSRSIS